MKWIAVISACIVIYFLGWLEYLVRKDKVRMPITYYLRQMWFSCRSWICRDIIREEMVQALHPDFGYIWQEDGEGWKVHQAGIQEGRQQCDWAIQEALQSQSRLLAQWYEMGDKLESAKLTLGRISDAYKISLTGPPPSWNETLAFIEIALLAYKQESEKQLGEIAERCRKSEGPCICGMHIAHVGGNEWPRN